MWRSAARAIVVSAVTAGALWLGPLAPAGSATAEAGTVVGLIEWCVPPAAVAPTGSGTPPVSDYRILLLPAPAEVTLSRGSVVVARESILYHFDVKDPSAALPYNGAVRVTGRFRLRAPAGAYVVTTPEVTRHVLVRAGRTTWVRTTLRSC